MFGQLRSRFVAWTLYRETVQQLNWLDKHMLADVGIEACDIKAVAKARARERAR